MCPDLRVCMNAEEPVVCCRGGHAQAINEPVPFHRIHALSEGLVSRGRQRPDFFLFSLRDVVNHYACLE